MATTPFAAEKIDIGRILSHAFRAIGRNPLLYISIAIVCLFIPGELIRVALTPQIAAGMALKPLTLLPYTLAGGLFGLILNVVAQAMLAHATVTDLNGSRPTFGNCFKTALPLILPLIGVGILVYFGIVLGMMLLLVPGIIFALMWSVSVPALVEERRGVLASMGRSRALTKGSRWRLFGLFLVAGLILLVPPALISGIAARLQGGIPSPLSPAVLLAGSLSALAAMLLATIIAATYVELRTVKEGATVESLAAVFD
ncbi:hypothetical protein [Polymorphobacter megasporae]|uniref:hypothetical protein n=1 Tax=Glacieibacterium megasporae TaxID=2835787 RepID=UPI001C1E6EC1|nr:hypothetical protein [Polymorphobacter megasporae]UAJ09763.1 hypothetical protein KTC28_15920 [Polymorphobacter megasporae]